MKKPAGRSVSALLALLGLASTVNHSWRQEALEDSSPATTTTEPARPAGI